MKATGIVRRVDDLGRIVIPKEIRRTLRIREGDPLEIYTEKDGGVIFRKYSPMGDMQETAAQLCEAIHAATGKAVLVADCDSILALSGAPKRDLQDKSLSQKLEKQMQERSSYFHVPGQSPMKALEDSDKYLLSAAVPILCQGDLIGAVMTLMQEGKEADGEKDRDLICTAAHFLGSQMEC